MPQRPLICLSPYFISARILKLRLFYLKEEKNFDYVMKFTWHDTYILKKKWQYVPEHTGKYIDIHRISAIISGLSEIWLLIQKLDGKTATVSGGYNFKGRTTKVMLFFRPTMS